MKQSLADRGDVEELVDAKLGGVHSTDSRLQPSQECLQPVTLNVGNGLLIML